MARLQLEPRDADANMMKPLWRRLVAITIVVSLALLASAGAAGAASGGAAHSLRRIVSRALSRSSAKALGSTVTIEGLGTVVDIAGRRALMPASTEKIYTAGAALLSLGADHRFVTEVRVTGTRTPDGAVIGDVTLVGSGDPSFSSDGLHQLATGVASAGISHVSGTVFVDDARYDNARSAPGWKSSYVPDETGPLSASTLDGNGWRRDADFITDPAKANADRFKQALADAGVSVDGPAASGASSLGPGEKVTELGSPSLEDLIAEMLKNSNNYYAEDLVKELGAVAGAGTTTSGIDAIKRTADSVGAPRPQTVDGSGLSNQDLTASSSQVAWLMAMDRTPISADLRNALPTACVDGTLRRRMCNTAAAGRVQAKTGTLPGVISLSGYTTTASNRKVWFSFVLNQVGSNARARDAIDRSLAAICAFKG